MNQPQPQAQPQPVTELQQFGRLWKKTSKAGQTYYSGFIGQQGQDQKKVMLFSNSHKRPDKQDPDLNLFLVAEAEPVAENSDDLF